MTPDKVKLKAALSVVSDSVINGWTIDAKIKFIKLILPDHYNVKESNRKGSVHCSSNIGISDDEQWEFILNAIKHRFSDFLELFHNTCHNHVDFTIYFKTV